MPKINPVEETLTKSDIHKEWENNYRNPENEHFMKLAFDYVGNKLGIPNDSSLLLDAGCGSCRHSVRFAQKGFHVMAVDYSEYIIKKAKEVVNAQGLTGNINVQQENLLGLSFEDEKFDYVVVWGVLMHIPDVEKAISELSRVLKKGGKLVISEVNMSSLEIRMTEGIRPFLKNEKIKSKKTHAGIEVWAKTDAGDLLSRKMDIQWLMKEFNKRGLDVLERKSEQFTKSYTRFSNKTLKWLIHLLNIFWFQYINLPSLACGNIIIFDKKHSVAE